MSRLVACSNFFQIENFILQYFRMTMWNITNPQKSRNNANLHVLQDPPLVIARSPLLTPVSSQLENKNFRSLIRPGKCVRSSLASQNSCTALATTKKKTKLNGMLVPREEMSQLPQTKEEVITSSRSSPSTCIIPWYLRERAWSWLLQATPLTEWQCIFSYYKSRVALIGASISCKQR